MCVCVGGCYLIQGGRGWPLRTDDMERKVLFPGLSGAEGSPRGSLVLRLLSLLRSAARALG